MHGTNKTSGSLFIYVDLEERIPPQHPLRTIRQAVNDALAHRAIAPLLFTAPLSPMLRMCCRATGQGLAQHWPEKGGAHFSADGTLIKARASMKSFQPKPEAAPPEDKGPDHPPSHTSSPDDQPAHPGTKTEPVPHPRRRNRNTEVDFKGEKRANATHASTPDPEAQLDTTSVGTGAVLCFTGGGGSQNGHGNRCPDDGADG